MATDLEAQISLLDKQLLESLEKATNLPSPPIVAMRILELSQDPDADIGMVADVVSMDPALVVKLLRMANSPFYAIRRKVENLRQAIMLLGLNGTLTMSLSFSLAASMHNNAGQGFDYNYFWRRSLAAATCCRRLSITAGLGASEEMFLSGLLQDVGMLAIDKMKPEFYSSLHVDQSDHVLLQAKERELLGADHAVIGAWLMKCWGLPDSIGNALLGSHDLELVDPESEFISYAKCVAVSGLLIDALSVNAASDVLEPLLQQIGGLLDIDEDAITEVMATLQEDFRESALLFETDLSDYSLSDDLVDQAKELMMLRNLKAIQQSDHLQQEAEKLEDRTRTLEQQATRDGLTGLYNRAYLDDKFGQEFNMAVKRGWPLVVMFIDLDHFKQVNDTYGHQAGDRILQETARRLDIATRDEDVVARYGGEEFVVVLPGCGIQYSNAVAERLLNTFREMVHTEEGEPTVVTASIGYSMIGDGLEFPDVASMLNAADKALYVAKRRGRNCAVAYSDEFDKSADDQRDRACSG